MFKCGLVRSNFSLAMSDLYSFFTNCGGSLAADAGDDLGSDRFRYRLGGVELHRVRRATLGARPKIANIPEHLGQRHPSADHLRVAALFHALDLAPPGV